MYIFYSFIQYFLDLKTWNNISYNNEDIEKNEYNYYDEMKGDNITDEDYHEYIFNIIDINNSLHIHNSKVEIKFAIVSDAGAKNTTDDKVAFVNTENFGKQFKLEINDIEEENIMKPDLGRLVQGLLS